RGALGDGERAGHRLLEHAQLLRALPGGDLLADAAIAAEAPGLVEDRRAAHAHPELPSADDAAKLEIVERAVRFHRRDLPRPVGGAHVDVIDVPEPLAEHAVAAEAPVLQCVLVAEAS